MFNTVAYMLGLFYQTMSITTMMYHKQETSNSLFKKLNFLSTNPALYSDNQYVLSYSVMRFSLHLSH